MQVCSSILVAEGASLVRHDYLDAPVLLAAGRGLEAERIATLGYGEARPIAGNETAAGRQQNRRVEIVVSDERGSFGDEDRRANLQ